MWRRGLGTPSVAPRVPLFLLAAACASGTEPVAALAPNPAKPSTLTGVILVDQRELETVDVRIEGDRIAEITPSAAPATRWLVPAFIDAHVHLAYDPRGEALLAGGIAAVVDLAAPESHLGRNHGALRVIAAGPMLTAPGGYPTESWGADGYGMIIRRAQDAVPSVERLHRRGARAIKIPIDRGPTLDDAVIQAIADRAHALGMRVYVHALSNGDALRAARLGADVLAHTPVERLTDETIEAWKDRAVVSTLAAFGRGAATKENLLRLHRAGATVLYGTDFGNTSTPGINPLELERLTEAGFTFEEILAMGTANAARYLGMPDLGTLRVAQRASFLVLATDPHERVTALASPLEVWIDGRPRP